MNGDTHHGSCAIWEIELLHGHQQCCPKNPTMEGHLTPLPALICPPRASQMRRFSLEPSKQLSSPNSVETSSRIAAREHATSAHHKRGGRRTLSRLVFSRLESPPEFVFWSAQSVMSYYQYFIAVVIKHIY